MKDAHLQNFLSFLKKTLDFPGSGRYNKTRSPARTPREYAPVAQLDRVSDYESEGRGFESLPAHQGHLRLQVTFFVYMLQSYDTVVQHTFAILTNAAFIQENSE